jgi:phosphoribosylformylglycinamidine cyclo-ligase
VVSSLVKDFAEACKAQGAVLTGGETSEQPAVLPAGTYVLGASCIGVAEKDAIIDGSTIKPGDIVLAAESSGLHTNGYTLVRALINEDPLIVDRKINGKTFLDLIMEPHRCYYPAIKGLFSNPGLHGLAHITGGGIPGNLNRILPEGMDAVIEAGEIRVLPIFSFIKDESGNDDADMIKTFNLGCGLNLVVDPSIVDTVIDHLAAHGVPCNPIGKIKAGGKQTVRMEGKVKW